MACSSARRMSEALAMYPKKPKINKPTLFLRRATKTTPINIQNITRVIAAIPFNHGVNGLRMIIMQKGCAVDINRVLNIESKSIKRPLLIVETH